MEVANAQEPFSTGYHSPEQLAAMAEAYRETCAELGIGDGDTAQHRMVALCVEELFAWHGDGKERVVRRAAARARSLGRLLGEAPFSE
jgi:hypothetical protein